MAFTYIVSCEDGTLYTGWTTNVEKRFAAHLAGKGAKYTRAHKPLAIVYTKEHDTKQAAMRQEWEIKQLPREEKLRLIAEFEASHKKE